MMKMTKRLLSAVVALLLIMAMVPASAMAEETKTAPNAIVTAMDPVTLAGGSYIIWPSGDGSVERSMDVVVNFEAEDTLEQCIAGGYKDWKVDFYLTVSNTANGSIVTDNCYLAGEYGTFGWVVIPADGIELTDGVANPVVAAYDANITYKQICESVKKFTAAIHVDDALWEANPDMEIKLQLIMTNPENADDTLKIGEDIIYKKSGLVDNTKTPPNAIVTAMDPVTLAGGSYIIWPSGDGSVDRSMDMVVNFKAEDTLEECRAGGYSKWKVDFYLTVSNTANGSITADNCYLAGEYGTFGWVVIPADDVVLEEGVSNPIVAAYDANITYKQICESVKSFTAAIHVDDALWEANPDMEIKLQLIMTNPENADDTLKIGEDIIYKKSGVVEEPETKLPQATVTPMEKQVLAEGEHRVWYGLVDGYTQGNKDLYESTENRPLEVVVNFQAQDTLEECLAGGYSKWLVDFNIRLDGLTDGTISGDDCYMAGNYGSFGWIAIPLDGITFQEGVDYPVVSLYDPTLNYKDICKSVKDFTAALHVDKAILNKNKNITVTLTLVMTNPENADDKMIIGMPLVYGYEELMGGVVAENVNTGYVYSDLDGLKECKPGETYRLLADVEEDDYVMLGAGQTLDLNGKTLTLDGTMIALTNTSLLVDSSNGEALIKTGAYQLIFASGENCAADGVACVPTWIEEDGGFRLAPVKFRVQLNPKAGGKAQVRFYFENNGVKGPETATLIANELADGKADNDGLKMYVRVNYTIGNSKQYTDVLINDTNMVKFGELWKTSTVNVTFAGLDSVTDVSFEVVIAGQNVKLAYTGELKYTPVA